MYYIDGMTVLVKCSMIHACRTCVYTVHTCIVHFLHDCALMSSWPWYAGVCASAANVCVRFIIQHDITDRLLYMQMIELLI